VPGLVTDSRTRLLEDDGVSPPRCAPDVGVPRCLPDAALMTATRFRPAERIAEQDTLMITDPVTRSECPTNSI